MRVIGIASLLIVFSSWSSELQREVILGTWKVESFETNLDMPTKEKESFINKQEHLIYNFQEGVLFLSSSQISYTEELDWSLNTEKRELTMKGRGGFGSSTNFKVVEFSDGRMVWEDYFGKDGKNKWNLVRQNETKKG